MKKKKTDRNFLSDALRLPEDVVKGESLLTFIGRSAVRIENYRGILFYTDTNIRIQAKSLPSLRKREPAFHPVL